MPTHAIRSFGLRIGLTAVFVGCLTATWLFGSLPDSMAAEELIATPLLLLTLVAGLGARSLWHAAGPRRRRRRAS